MLRSRLSVPSPKLSLALLLSLSLLACGKKEPGADAAAAPAGTKTAAAKASAAAGASSLLVAAEDVREMSLASYASGPVITGSVQPEKRADLRAEVSAVVLQVLKENGETVRRGDLLVRLDDTSIRDSLASAEESVRVSGQSFEQAERQMQRLKTLQAQGMSSMQALEDAELRRNNAQNEQVAAKARLVQARQQLQRTEVRAPFDGVVSERKVSVGDTAQIGKELVKVMDPRSMRFEGLVSADRMKELKPGQTVSFRVNGFSQDDFAGKIRRIDAAANATTRQLEVIVDFLPGKAPQVAGLYAEGRVEASSVSTLMLDEAALLREGEQVFAWRLRNGLLSKVALELGERDARRGEFIVRSGLQAGDKVLRKPGSNLQDGQKVEIAAAAVAAATAASGSANSRGK